MNREMDDKLRGMREKPVETAIRELKAISRKYPKSSRPLLLLAAIAFEAEMYLEAGKAFEKLITLRPKSNMISLGLFHSLWGQERFGEALEEIKRFLETVGKSRHKRQINEYMEILREIKEKACQNENT